MHRGIIGSIALALVPLSSSLTLANGIVLVGHDRRIESSAFAANAEDSDSQILQQVAPDGGPFESNVNSIAEVVGAEGNGLGTQSSSIEAHAILAIGSHSSFAEAIGSETLAYAHGASNLALRFMIETQTTYVFRGFAESFGLGLTNVTLSRPFQTIEVFIASSDEHIDFDEEGSLAPGTYDLNITSGGTISIESGQSGTAYGGYDLEFTLGGATGTPIMTAGGALRAFPNPFTAQTLIVIPENAGSVRVFDIAGRLVRTLEGAGAQFWNGRDETGSIAPSGVYWMRASQGSSEPVKLVRVR